MDLKLNIGFNELLKLIKQLPPNQILKLKEELTVDIPNSLSANDITAFQRLLLAGPVMKNSQLTNFKKLRSSLIKWRRK